MIQCADHEVLILNGRFFVHFQEGTSFGGGMIQWLWFEQKQIHTAECYIVL